MAAALIRSRSSLRLLLAAGAPLLLALASAGCATLPRDPVESALYVDLRKSVEVSEDSGWVVDSAQLRNASEGVMRSVCQVDPALRDDLEAWISGQIMLAGGPAERIYRQHGGKLGPASRALSLERTRLLLRYGRAHAAEDCPFWLNPDPEFRGTQGDAGRFVLLAETAGFASVVINTRTPALGGGGRLLLGHGIGSKLTLAAGGEVGGSGTFVPGGSDKNTGLDAIATAGIPVLLRLTRYSRIFDIELAPVVRFSRGQDAFPPGARVQIGAGITTMRGASFMPYGMLYIGYEIHPTTKTAPADHTVLVGTRLAVNWAP